MDFLGHKRWSSLGFHAVLLGNISKTVDKLKKMHMLSPNTEDFNEASLYRFCKMMLNKHSNFLYFSLIYTSRSIQHYI